MQKNKKLFNLALATTMAAGAVVAVAPADADAAKAFSDLKTTDSHYPNVTKLVERGVISGFEDGTFKPNEPIKRGHAAKIIAKALGLDTKNVKNPGFKDIPTTFAYYGEIAALANAGIINGFPDGTYKYDQTLTRGQMAKIIANAFELKADNSELPFKDITKSPYKDQIAALFTNKVTTGKTATTFDALSPVTRGQLASFVVRAEEAKATTPGSEAADLETIVGIKDGKVVTANGTFEISAELAKVFNAENAAALKDAKVELVFEDVKTAKLASLNNLVAVKTGKIVGIKALTLVAENTSFNAGGYAIPSVTINANSVEISGVKADKLTIGDGLQVTLKSVEVKELAVSAGTKLTLDINSKIDKLVVPEGAKLQDIISNYSQVKNVIKETVDTAGKTVSQPSSGGGGGGRDNDDKPTPSLTTKEKLEEAIKDFNTEFSSTISPFGDLDLSNISSNTIGFEISNESKTLSEVRTDLKAKQDEYSLADILDKVSYLGTLYDEVNGVTVVVNKPDGNKVEKEFEAEDILFSKTQPNKSLIITLVDTFVEDVVPGTTTLGKFVDQYGEKGKIQVKVDFKNDTDPTYNIVLTK